MTNLHEQKNIKADYKGKRLINKMKKAKTVKLISTPPEKRRQVKIICGTDKKGRLVIEGLILL